MYPKFYYEAPRAYARGFFSASQLKLCYVKHSSTDLHPWFSALADKSCRLEDFGYKLARTLENQADVLRQESIKKLDELIASSNKILFKISSVFPFDFFPNDVILDENKISIVRRSFFISGSIEAIPLKNIEEVLVEAGPFFATLKVIDERYKDSPFKVSHLWKEEAIKLRNMIQGLITIKNQGISIAKLNPEELQSRIEEIGKAASRKEDEAI